MLTFFQLEEWIAENRHTISTKETRRREKQLEVMKHILRLYDEEKEGETHKISEARKMKILELNAAFDELGDLPPEVEKKSVSKINTYHKQIILSK